MLHPQSPRFSLRFFAMLSVLSIAMAQGDVLELRSGGRLEGDVEVLSAAPANPTNADNPENGNKRIFYRITLPSGVRLAISQHDIRQHLKDDAALSEYRTRAAAAKSAEAHWELAKWCKSQSMLDRAQLHVEKVVELDPDNGVARAWLGQVKFQGQWMPKDQMQRMRGMVYRDNKWQIPETALINEDIDKTTGQIRIWTTNLTKLRKEANSPRTAARALGELKAVKDPLASAGVAKLLLDSGEKNLEMKQLYLDLLSQWNTSATIQALIRASVTPEEPTIRERAMQLLSDKAPAQGAYLFTQMLKDKNNLIVERAAVALAHMPQHDTIPYLIDALITKHMPEDTPLPNGATGIGTSFSPTGGNNFSFGQKRPQPVEMKNRSVLSALITLAPEGQSNQYDEAGWHRWYAQRAEYRYPLRRDP